MVASAVISMVVVGVGVVVVEEDVVDRKEEGQKRVGCLPFASVQDVNWHSMILSLWRAGLMIVARPKTVPVVVAGSSSMDILRFFDVLWLPCDNYDSSYMMVLSPAFFFSHWLNN